MCAPSAPANPSASEAGFSLLEALIGLAILSLTLTSVFSAATLGLKQAARAADRTSALLEARSLIDRVGVDLPLAEGTYDGMTDRGRRYRLVIEPFFAANKDMLDAFTVEADIGLRRGGPALVSLRTLRTAEAAQ